MIKNFFCVFCICLLVFLFNSCAKTPGQGGNASIKGKVWVKKYDPFFTILEYEYPGSDMTVELTFGNNTSPDLSEKTNAAGEFQFLYLRKGRYKVTVYSKVFQNAQNPSGQVPVEMVVNIDNKKGSYDAGTLTVQR
ncbi:MAG: carboxypeptidase regulatory-like domain-containing protein [Bacteroidetes bacterium]|nr:carboxypeptidase regulatory-like domain-containing protein [Bacteroidota bacterium]